MKYSRTNLKKLEELCKDLGYKVRYEQGYFQSGYCRVETQKVIVINKFFDVEGRMNCFFDLIPQLNIDESALSPETLKIFQNIIENQTKIEA
ncbi:MAG: hypothetical protein IPO62_10395 [Saprospiraceae bacterium]|nr:hypothetical protein [Saprospiraceae bacterium]